MSTEDSLQEGREQASEAGMSREDFDRQNKTPQQLTVKDFRSAMVIVEDYCQQVYELKNNIGSWRIGATVKLSKWGREMQRPHNRKGKVVDCIAGYSKKDSLLRSNGRA